MITCFFKEIQLEELPYIYKQESYSVGILYHSVLPFTTGKNDVHHEPSEKHLGKEWENKYLNSYYRNKKRQYHLLQGRIDSKNLIKKYFLNINEKDKQDFKDNEIKDFQNEDQNGKSDFILMGKKQDFSITIAYCDEFAGALVGEGCRVGMDIKGVKEFDDYFMYMISNSNERNMINENISELSLIKKWTLFWTIKEAIGKALGVGLCYGFNSIQVYFNTVINSIQINVDEKIEGYVEENILEIKIYYQFVKNSCCTFCIIKEK